MVIQVPPKVWIPKIKNIYIPPNNANDIDEVVFDFHQYRKALYRPKKLGKKGIVKILISND